MQEAAVEVTKEVVAGTTGVVGPTVEKAASGGLSALGVNPLLLAGQILNFSIIFFVVYKLIYGPLMKGLKAKQEKEQEAKKFQEKIKQEWESLDRKIKNKYEETKKDAQKMIKEAREEAEKEREIILTKTKKDAQEIIKRARIEAEKEQKANKKQMEKEVIELAAKVSQKLIGEYLKPSDQRALIAKATKMFGRIRV